MMIDVDNTFDNYIVDNDDDDDDYDDDGNDDDDDDDDNDDADEGSDTPQIRFQSGNTY